jgi:FHS family Na+ dependent glucose MFS transporter 1
MTTSIQSNITRANWSKTAVYFTAFITIGLTNAVLGPTLPNLAANTGTALGEIGFLFTARSLGFTTGALFGARLFDRLPGHRLMAIAIVGMSLTLALTPTINQIWVMTAVLFLMGFAENMVDVGGNTLLVWVHGAKVGPYMNGLHFFFGVGAFLSPIVVAQVLLHSDGIGWAYWLLALVFLPVSLFVGMLPSPTAVHQQSNQSTNAVNRWLIGLIMAFFFIYVGMEVGFGGWIFTYATTLGLVNDATAAYLTSAFWGALTTGRLLSIPLAARLRPSAVLILDLLGALVSVGTLLIWRDSAVALWLGTIGIGFFFASVFPTTLALAGRRMTITGKVTGWLFVGASLGGAALPWLMGALLEDVGATAVSWSILLGLLVDGGLLFFIMRCDKIQENSPVLVN